jgi:hypothetical protein
VLLFATTQKDLREKPETRTARLTKTIELLAKGRKNPGGR